MTTPAGTPMLRHISDSALRQAVQAANASDSRPDASYGTTDALYAEIERRITLAPLDVETVFTLNELLYGADELTPPPANRVATLARAVAHIYAERQRATFADIHRYIAFLFMALLYVPGKKAEIEYEISHIFDTWLAGYNSGNDWPDTDSAETGRRAATLLASEAYLSYTRYLSARTALITAALPRP